MRDNINKNQPLVSIITPCFNGESYVANFLDSVLNQTYTNIEFIFVNDGSTDKTEEIALSYKEKFENIGINFIYIYQENKGPAAALNKGLSIFKGQYLTWPDSDDILDKDNILQRVMFLENNNRYNVVLCNSVYINESGKKIGQLKRIPTKADNIFLDLITETNISFAGGAYMVRASAFIQAIPKRKIFESRGGQNWQMLLPVLYNNKCGYLDIDLYYIYKREGSHSRKKEDFEESIKRLKSHEDILVNTIDSISNMPDEEKDKYYEIVQNKYLKKRLVIYSRHRKIDELKKTYKTLKNKKVNTFTDQLVYICGKYTVPHYLEKSIRSTVRTLRRIKEKI
jgi:glycosyltransferase involved in cell wall biosynthesis